MVRVLYEVQVKKMTTCHEVPEPILAESTHNRGVFLLVSRDGVVTNESHYHDVEEQLAVVNIKRSKCVKMYVHMQPMAPLEVRAYS
jgi:hypothetical protein